ncbi:MAG: hypothetical protein ACT4QG_17580 [Sporichthyaceae bacterium]
MQVRPTLARIAISSAVLVGSLAVIAPAAQAGIACDYVSSYHIVSNKGIHMPFPGLHYKDGKGGTISVEVAKSASVASQWGTTVEAEIGALFAKVKSNVSYSSVRETSSTIGHTYSRTISKGKYGNVRYGAWANEVHWREVVTYRNCNQRVLKEGVARVATEAHGFKYWETKS